MLVEKTLKQTLSFLTDPLTGLANRSGLEEHLKRLDLDEKIENLYLMTMELSRFGKVNDSLGSDLGNKIICAVAKRLQKIFPNAQLIARTHGDHFCLVLQGDIDINEQIELLHDFTQRPLAISGKIIVLSVRVGVAVLGPLVENPSKLLYAAEVALNRAKRDHIKRCFYHRDLCSEARAAHTLENDLRVSLAGNYAELYKAISNDEFRILYQPIVNVVTKQVHAMEALIRWHHPKRGLISPAEFIPMAEQIEVMDLLGGWIMRRACIDAMTFPRNKDGSQTGISINVSATQFLENGILLETVKQALNESGIEPSLVKLEITESTSFGADKISIIEDLRALGCMIALDDFGTGYSSLTQLHSLPLDYIKLDQSFITAIGGDDESNILQSDHMIRAILSIASTFDLKPIVEGVETVFQRDRLQQNGGSLMQGYLFAKPLPLEEARLFISNYITT